MDERITACCEKKRSRGKKRTDDIPASIREDLDHQGGLKKLSSQVPHDDELARESRIYHALSDPLRLKILYLLKSQPLCVCVIKQVVRIADSRLSYHLTILREAGFLVSEAQGNFLIYRITDAGRYYLTEQHT